jgi:hypothetical protein
VRRRRPASAPILWRDLPPADPVEALAGLAAIRAALDEWLDEGARLRVLLDVERERIAEGVRLARAKRAAA